VRSVATGKIYAAQTDRGEANEKHFMMLENRNYHQNNNTREKPREGTGLRMT
jgi:hypothetical protein